MSKQAAPREPNLEIERKFLVSSDAWRAGATGTAIRQGYLARGDHSVVRVRTRDAKAFLTIKSELSTLTRQEFEYPIPLADAEAMLALCEDGLIEKTRFCVDVGQHMWEIDVFEGANAGLIVAEIELGAEDEAFEKPDWLGEEVSADRRYLNSSLSQRPYGPDWD